MYQLQYQLQHCLVIKTRQQSKTTEQIIKTENWKINFYFTSTSLTALTHSQCQTTDSESEIKFISNERIKMKTKFLAADSDGRKNVWLNILFVFTFFLSFFYSFLFVFIFIICCWVSFGFFMCKSNSYRNT